MYTQEIICPYCGKMTRVNVADGEGTVTTPCQNTGGFFSNGCGKKISVTTDEDGNVVSIGKSRKLLKAGLAAAGAAGAAVILAALTGKKQ